MHMGIRADGLSAIEFEEFAIALAQKKYNNCNIFGFAEGRDHGIDAIDDIQRPGIIVQAKRWQLSKNRKQAIKLIKEEIKKILKTKEAFGWELAFKYVFITSWDLTPNDLKEIIDFSKKYYKQIEEVDIIYASKLNVLSKDEKYKNVFENHGLLEKNLLKVLKDNRLDSIEIESRNYFSDEKSRFFVETSILWKAYKRLLDEHIIIINGPAGIGKTTTCMMLGNLFANNFDQCDVMVRKVEDIDKALETFNSLYINESVHATSSRSLVIIFDDFLGRNQLDVNDRYFVDIDKLISAVKNSENLFVCLNSRTQILRTAESSNYNFRNAMKNDISENSTISLDLSQYTRVEKASITRIIFERKVSKLPELKQQELSFKYSQLTESDWSIVLNHNNWFPRLLELVVDNFQQADSKFSDYIISSLDNPESIYSELFNKFEKDIKLLLFSIFMFDKYPVHLSRILISMERILSDMTFDTKKSLQELDGSWISIVYNDKEMLINFFNPSIVDFLKNKISEMTIAKKHILKESVFLHQIIGEYPLRKLGQHESAYISFYQLLINDWNKYEDRKDFIGEKLLAIIYSISIQENEYSKYKDEFWRLANEFKGTSRLFLGQAWKIILESIVSIDNYQLKRDTIMSMYNPRTRQTIFDVCQLESEEFDSMVNSLNKVLYWLWDKDRAFLLQNKVVKDVDNIIASDSNMNLIKYTKLYRNLRSRKIILLQNILDSTATIDKISSANYYVEMDNTSMGMDIKFRQLLTKMEKKIYELSNDEFSWGNLMDQLCFTDFKLNLEFALDYRTQYSHLERYDNTTAESRDIDEVNGVNNILNRPLVS